MRLRSRAVTTPQTGFTCPFCARTSSHPEDGKAGYCGACHAYTGDVRNPLVMPQPLILWLGSMTAQVAVIQPCEDPRRAILGALRKVVDSLAAEVDEDQADAVLEQAADRPLVDEPPTWPPDLP